MFNVRIIKYKTGYQVRVYSDLVGHGSTGRIDDELELDYLDNNGDLHVVKLGSETGRTTPKYLYGENPFSGEYERFRTFEDIERSQRVSRNRTKNNLFYYARSNEWEWFVTFTLNDKRVNRFDYDEITSKLSDWLSNMRRLSPNMKYLVVPELHKNGAFHFHGLFANCDELEFIESGHYDDNGNMIYNVGKYRFGFTEATRVRNTQAVSRYITKYVTKELCAVTFNRKRYWKSRNLDQAEMVDLILTNCDKRDFIEQLYDVSTWMKTVNTDYVDIKYFELPADIEIDLSNDEVQIDDC